MTDSGFDWKSSDQRHEDPLRLTVQPSTPLLVPETPDPVLEARLAQGGSERAQAQPSTLDPHRATPDHQRAAAAPVLEAARLDRADASERQRERADLGARVAELRDGLPEHALEAAQQREARRRNPPVPTYFATPPQGRPPGAQPGAADWVGLYAYEMHGQQLLGGSRGIEGRAAADIQRRAVTGLGQSYRENRLPLDARAREYGGHLAELGGWPLGAQVGQVFLNRLSPLERPAVQSGLAGAQAERAALAQQDRRALDAHALEGRLNGQDQPLAQRPPPGTSPQVVAQLKRGLNTGPGAFAGTGQTPDGSDAEASRVEVQTRGRTGAGAFKAVAAPSASPSGPRGVVARPADQAAPTTEAKKSPEKRTASTEKDRPEAGREAADQAKGKHKASAKSPAKQPASKPKQAVKAGGKANAGSQGGKGSGGPVALRAVPTAQVPKNLNLQPVMQLNGQAVFEDAQWKKAVAKQRPAKPRLPGQAAFTTPVAPTVAPRKAAARPPLSKLGKTISAAKLKQIEARERKAAQAQMTAFVRRNTAKVKALEAAKKAIAPKVNGAARAAEAKIAGAARTASAQVAAAASKATAQAQAAASSAKARITAEHKAATTAIKAATKSSEAELKAAHTAAVQALTQKLTALNTATDQEFTTAATRAQGIADRIAGAAQQKGEARAAQYAAEPLAHQSGWENFVNGSDYPAKKREAKVQAAKSVGKGYHDELQRNGNEYAAKLPEGASKVHDGNQKLLTEYTKSLDKQLQQNLQSLQKAQTQAVKQADTALKAQLQSVSQQLQSARSSIAQQRSSLTSQIGQQASQQRAAVQKAARSSIPGLQKAADQAVSGIRKQIAHIGGQLHGKGVPDNQALKTQLAKADGQITSGIGQAKNSISGGAQKVASGLAKQGAGAASSLAATARQGAQGISQVGSQSAKGIAQVATAAAQQFKALGSGFQKMTASLVKQAQAATQKTEHSFDADGKKIVTGVREQLTKATTQFQADMQKGMSGEDAKITEEANKAADKVQPRWKGWVSILIDIVIAVAVTALVLATGGVAGIVLGIVAGAVGGVLGQLAKDGLNGQLSSWQTYAAAALGGAIGGALGAGGGALSGLAAKAISKQLVSVGVKEGLATAAKVGVDFVGNNITGLVSQTAAGFVNSKVFGTPFNLSDVFSVKNIAQNALMTGVGMGAGKYFHENPGMLNRMRGVVGKGPLPEVKVNTPALNDGTKLNVGEPGVTGGKTNPELPGVKPTAERPASTGGKEPPMLPPGREPPALNAAPRPKELSAPPVRKALPAAPERPALPPGRGEGGEPGTTAGREPASPRFREPSDGGLPDVSEQFTTRTYERNGNQYVETSGRLGEPGKVQTHRDPAAQRRVSQGTGDDAGHRIGDRFGAPGDESNLAQQNWRSNRNGTFKNLENRWAASRKQGVQIEAKVTDVTRPGERRPFMRRAEWTETHPDGTVTHHEEVFGNFHTPESRAQQNIPDRVSEPQTDNVIPVDFKNRRRITDGPEGPDGSGPEDGGTSPVGPVKPKGPQGPDSGAAEPPTNEGPQARRREESGSETSQAETPFKPSDLQGRFRGDPFAFGKGPRAERAQAMVQEATKASGISDLKKYVDVVTYEEGSSYFMVDEHGNRILNVGSNAFGRTKVGQIHEVAHELVHAQQFQRVVLKHGGDVELARQEFMGAEFGSSRYALDEVVAEKLAMRRVEKYMGEVSPQQKAVSSKYAKQWREQINWNEVFNESAQSSGGVSAKPRGGNSTGTSGVRSERTGLPEAQGTDGPRLRDESGAVAGVPEGTRPLDAAVRVDEPTPHSPNPAVEFGGQASPRSSGVRPEGTGLPGVEGADGPGLRDGREGVAGLRESTRSESPLNPDLNPTSVTDLPGRMVGEYDYTEPGPLAPDKAATFVGQRYKVVELHEDMVVYRVGELDKPLGQFFDTQKPVSEIQSRIDKAVLPQWPGGGASPIDAVHAVRVPKGTKIYVGEVANQGGYFMGGTRQVVVLKPWEIGGLEVLSSEPINRIQIEPAIPAETVGGVQAVTPKTVDAPQVAGPPKVDGPPVQPRLHQTPKTVKENGELATTLRAKLPQENGAAVGPSKLPPERLSEPPQAVQSLPDAFREAPAFVSSLMATWEELGSGGNKDVYGVSDQHVLAVLKPGRNPEGLVEELGMLDQLQELGLPTVRGELTLVDGYPALLLGRFSEGSKTVVRLERGKVRIVGDSRLLTERSVHDLQVIKQKMQENKIKIDDLQFLVGEDGSVVIADPLAVHLEEKPSSNNIRMIDLLIQQALKNSAPGSEGNK